MGELFASVKALGLVMAWGSKGASIRLKSPDQAEPISIGWVFLEGDQWTWAKYVTLGVDPNTLKNHPSVAPAILDFCEKLKSVPGGQPAGGKSNARIFEPTAFVAARDQLIDLPRLSPGVPLSSPIPCPGRPAPKGMGGGVLSGARQDPSAGRHGIDTGHVCARSRPSRPTNAGRDRWVFDTSQQAGVPPNPSQSADLEQKSALWRRPRKESSRRRRCPSRLMSSGLPMPAAGRRPLSGRW
jgi:hypothetical protein